MRHNTRSLIVWLVIVSAACSVPATPSIPVQVPPTAGSPAASAPASTPASATATSSAPPSAVAATPITPGADFGLQPPSQPYAPQAGDAKLVRGSFFIDRAQIVVAESFPPQFILSLSGSLPTPCHLLRLTVALQAANHRVLVDVYTLAEPQAVCAQVLQPVSVNVPLGRLPQGRFEVWLNDQPVGEVEAP